MTSIYKKIGIQLLLIFVLLSFFTPYCNAVVNPTSKFYVNDYAGILNNETENYIVNTNQSLQRKTGAQIVVVTVKNLEGKSLEEYATTLFRKFGIGDSKKNNGLLLLLALEERQFRVEVGYGLEGVLPDAKTGRIQDEYIIPYLKKNEWDKGVLNGYNAFLSIIAKEYGVQIENIEEPIKVGNYEINILKILGISMTAMIFLVASIILGLITRKNKKKMLIIDIIYWIASFIILKIVIIDIELTLRIMFIGFIQFILSMLGIVVRGGSSGGGFSSGRVFLQGGGFSGGGGSSGGGRKLKKFLKRKKFYRVYLTVSNKKAAKSL